MRALVLAGLAAAIIGVPVPAQAAADTKPAVTADAEITAGVAVFDRQAGVFTEQRNSTLQFRSASIVKLLMTLDFLWERGPNYDIPAADRARLDPMLRSSDDNAANYYWANRGYEQIVQRMVPRLGLLQTTPPPTAQRGYWGYTATSAADTVRIYRYLLEKAPAKIRDYVMGNLRQSTRCAADGYDQSFGIPSAFARPWAVKQGWSGFPDRPEDPCMSSAAPKVSGVDLASEALHTTGTVGAGDRTIVAVFTLHPDGTRFAPAFAATTDLVRSLNVPGATPAPAGKRFSTWGTNVPVYAEPTSESERVGTIPSGVDVEVECQQRGEEVVVEPYRNDWWAYLPEYGGYMTNIYIHSPDNELPDVPLCRAAAAAS